MTEALNNKFTLVINGAGLVGNHLINNHEKIFLVTDQFIYPGGISRYVHSLFKELVKRGLDVHVISYYDGIYINVSASNKHVVLSKRIHTLVSFLGKKLPPPFPDPLFLIYVLKIILKSRPSLIHTHGWSSFSIIPIASILKIPLVVRLHDYGFICIKRDLFNIATLLPCENPSSRKCLRCGIRVYGYKAALLYMLHRLFVKLLIRLGRAFIAPSEYVKEVHLEYQSSYLKGKLVTIPNFTSLSYNSMDHHEDIDGRYKIPNDYILYVGKVSLHKGVLDLIKSFIMFKRVNRDCYTKLVIVGSLHNEVKRMIERVTKEVKDIVITGEVPDSELEKIYAGAKCVILPSRWPEVFGLTILEAMLYRKPIIVTRVGGLAELARVYPYSYVCNSADYTCLANAIKEVTCSSNIYSLNTKNRSENVFIDNLLYIFSPQRIIDEIVKLYEVIITSIR